MSIPITFNGVEYDIPEFRDTNYANELTQFFVAIPNGSLQPTGGLFTLLAEVDFGASYGLKSLYVKSRATNPAAAGIFRLGNAETISWRNALNDADKALTVNASNLLQFAGANVFVVGTTQLDNSDIAAAAGISFSKLATLTAGNILVGSAGNVATSTTMSGDMTLNSSGVAAISAGVIVDADINASAAIARTKIASGTADHVLINSGAGVMSSEAQLAVTRGGTGQSSYTDGQLLIGNSSGNTLTKAALTGTSNQVVVTNGNGSITLSLPQSIATTSDLRFGSLTLNGAADASALLTLTSTTKGLLFPRMTTTQRDAIVSPTDGLQIYNTSTGQMNVRAGSAWAALAASGGGTVNSGTQYQLSYYAANGTAVSGLTAITGDKALISDANGLPIASAVTATELGYVSGVTSAIQTQMNLKAPLANPTFSGTITTPLTASRALVTGASSELAVSAVTAVELGYVSGVTSAIQTQLGLKAPLAGPTFTGTVTIPTPFTLGAVSVTATGTEINYLVGVSSAIQTQFTGKASLALDNLSAVAINTSLLPATDNAINVGSATKAYAGTFQRSVNSSYIGGLHNKLINGDMAIDQRKEGTAVTVNSTSTFPGLDRWKATGGAAAGVFTFARASATPPTGFNYYLRSTVTTADASPASGASYSVRQDIESFNMPDVYTVTGMTAVTLSFWVRSSVTGTYGVGIVNLDASSIRSYVGQYTINAANTWEYKTIIVPADVSTNTLTYGNYSLQVRFDLGSGSSREGTASAWTVGAFWRASSNTKLINTNAATWDVTAVQLEAGGVPSTYESLPFDVQLQRCQRYFEKSYKIGTAPGTSETSNQYIVNASQFNTTSMEAGNIAFKARKRTIPTVTLYQSSGASNNWEWVSTAGVTSVRTTTVPEITETAFAIRQTVAVEYLGLGHWAADGE